MRGRFSRLEQERLPEDGEDAGKVSVAAQRLLRALLLPISGERSEQSRSRCCRGNITGTWLHTQGTHTGGIWDASGYLEKGEQPKGPWVPGPGALSFSVAEGDRNRLQLSVRRSHRSEGGLRRRGHFAAQWGGLHVPPWGARGLQSKAPRVQSSSNFIGTLHNHNHLLFSPN